MRPSSASVRSPQLFGFGLIDNIPDSAILANVAVTKKFGITGIANMVPDENACDPSRPIRAEAGRGFAVPVHTPTRNSTNFGITTSNSLFGDAEQFNPNEHNPARTCVPDVRASPTRNAPQDAAQVNMIKMTQFESLLAPIPPQPPTSQTTRWRSGVQQHRLQHLPHPELHHSAERNAARRRTADRPP